MSFDGSTRNVVVTETVSETVDEANNLSFSYLVYVLLMIIVN